MKDDDQLLTVLISRKLKSKANIWQDPYKIFCENVLKCTKTISDVTNFLHYLIRSFVTNKVQ